MVDSTLDRAVESQLWKTVDPTSYNRRVSALIWLFSHITAYCTLRQLHHGCICMEDFPEEMDEMVFMCSTKIQDSGCLQEHHTQKKEAQYHGPQPICPSHEFWNCLHCETASKKTLLTRYCQRTWNMLGLAYPVRLHTSNRFSEHEVEMQRLGET